MIKYDQASETTFPVVPFDDDYDASIHGTRVFIDGRWLSKDEITEARAKGRERWANCQSPEAIAHRASLAAWAKVNGSP